MKASKYNRIYQRRTFAKSRKKCIPIRANPLRLSFNGSTVKRKRPALIQRRAHFGPSLTRENSQLTSPDEQLPYQVRVARDAFAHEPRREMGRCASNGHGKVLVKVAQLFMVALHALSRDDGSGGRRRFAPLRSASLRSAPCCANARKRPSTRASHNTDLSLR